MQEVIKSMLRQGQTLLNLGNPKDALACYEQILLHYPENSEALLKKGHILGKLARYEQAITVYEAVLLQDKKNLLALLNKGLAHHYIGEYNIAIQCFDKVLDKKPKNTTALYNKASSLVRSNKTKDGLEILEKVILTDSSYRAKAICDLDFEEVRRLNEFKKIVST